MIWLYRNCLANLKDSMKSLKKFYTLYGVISYIAKKEKCEKEDINIFLYCDYPDDRINWDYTYIVCVKNEIVGFLTQKYI